MSNILTHIQSTSYMKHSFISISRIKFFQPCKVGCLVKMIIVTRMIATGQGLVCIVKGLNPIYVCALSTY